MGWLTGPVPQRTIDPTIVGALDAALQEMGEVAAQVSEARRESSGLRFVNWSGAAADEHRQRLLEAGEALSEAEKGLSALTEALRPALVQARRVVEIEDQTIRAWQAAWQSAPQDAFGRLL